MAVNDFGWYARQSTKESSKPAWTRSSTQAEVPDTDAAKSDGQVSAQIATDSVSDTNCPIPVAAPPLDQMDESKDAAPPLDQMDESKDTAPPLDQTDESKDSAPPLDETNESKDAAPSLDQTDEAKEVEIASVPSGAAMKMEAAKGTRASAKKIQANRENAKKSTGPKTERGKKSSSLNAIKHGFLAQAVVLKDPRGGESQEEFDRLHAELGDYFEPANYMEDMFVQTMVIALWKRRRGLRCENATISNQFRSDRISSKGRFADLKKSLETEEERKQRELEGPASDDMLSIPASPDRFLRYEAFLEKQFNTAYLRFRELQALRHRAPK